MKVMKTKITFFIFFTIILAGCGKSQKELSEAEKKIISLASQSAELIMEIEKYETHYSQNKSSKNWKYYYNQKREGLDSLNRQISKIIIEVRFFERMPDEETKKLAADLLHACENIRMYLNTTNVDLGNYYKTAPPAYDPYNWDRLIVPALKRIETIVEKDKSKINANKFKGSRHYLSQPAQEDVNRQIQSSPQKMEEWKEEVESTTEKLPETKIKK